MKKQSKRIEKLITKVTNQPIYSIDEGILLLRETEMQNLLNLQKHM